MPTALAGSLDKLLLWAVGLFFTNPKLSPELYTAVIGIYEFHDRTAAVFMTNLGSEPVSFLSLEKRNAIRSIYFAHYRRRSKRYLGIYALNPVLVTVLVATSI